MKTILNKITLCATILLLVGTVAKAQQVNTLYFLENAPMRHTINPAFQPVSKGYINFTPLGWMAFGFGNNSLTMSDVLFYDKNTGKTITPFHPDADKQKFLKQFRNMTYINGDFTLGLLNMGFRIKDDGFLTIGINERMDLGVTIPKSLFSFIFDGGMKDLNGGINKFSLAGMGIGASLYTELGVGYSHKLDEQWTIGGKFKLLAGQMYIGLNSKDFAIDASIEEWRLHGNMGLDIAGPVNFDKLPAMEGRQMEDIINDFKNGSYNIEDIIDYQNIGRMLTPSGFGAAIDFGFTYKPIENLQISAALTDLGFIYWYNGQKLNCAVDTVFTGVGEFNYNDYVGADGKFDGNALADTIKNNMMGLTHAFLMGPGKGSRAKMVSARLNVGLDANFWDNRIGIGILSATRLYNARLYEEVTIGVALRPCNWFNIAASYSFMDNGKFSNIGAGLSFMPYDGINMTLTMDYLPTSYAGIDINGQKKYVIPDKMKMFNMALGFSICWGSNKRDKDKDGVWDKLDMCPDTPLGVQVDEQGCPLDEDHDGVPDYLDQCLGTPEAAIGFIDSVGCMLDTDGDGVEDYRDLCPNTPEAAWGKVDSVGCPLDTDGDGVPDYLDECPDTPEAAYGKINDKGCPLDTDGDGVPDYLDECPDTPEAAYGHINDKGCELDTDGDGVPDYLDACPLVPGVKNNKGCPEVKREVRQLLQKAMQGIEFETGKAAIKKKSFPLLNQIATIFVENGNYIVEVQGHTDNVGKPESNKKLSDQRANSVMKYLISQGVPADRLSAVGYGQEVPIADNKTKAGRAKNRRVEFKISFEEVHYETVLDHAE